MDIQKFSASEHGSKLKSYVKLAEAIRQDNSKPTDITFAEVIKDKTDMDMDAFYESLGVDPAYDTIENLFTSPDASVRWLIPEIFRDSLRLGYRKAPIWPNIIAMEDSTTGLSQIIPSVNMSDATPRKVGEGETIPMGTLSYQSKKFSIHKFGRGIKIVDEVSQYVSLNVISLYLQDFGIKMGMGVDTLGISTLINGEQADGSEAAPVVGVKSTGTLTFRDILKVWIRMAAIGRIPTTMLGGEDMAIETWDLTEFKRRAPNGNNPDGAPMYTMNLHTPIPQGADYFIHGLIGANQQLILDPSSALLKLNAQPLKVESERIVSNQSEAFYASFTTGFAKMFTDACVIMDISKDFTVQGFPAAMDIYSLQSVLMS